MLTWHTGKIPETCCHGISVCNVQAMFGHYSPGFATREAKIVEIGPKTVAEYKLRSYLIVADWFGRAAS